VAVFWFARPAVTERAMTPEAYATRRNLWLACVFTAFFSFNFWIFITLAGAILFVAARRDKSPLALYCMLLFAIPNYTLQVPGFGIVNFLFDIHYARVLSLVILLPLALKLRAANATSSGRTRLPDACVALYIVVNFVIQALDDTLTNSLRSSFYSLTDIWLPYYVASRALTSFEEYRAVASAFLISVAIMAAIAAFETSRFWLLYNALRYALDAPPPLLLYLTRGAGGLLRAKAATNQPIVLGYQMMIAISLFTFLRFETIRTKTMWLAGGCLVAGLVASLSRGPWVGTAIALLLVVALGPGKGKRIVWSAGAVMAALVVLAISPFGRTLLEYLPFVGSVEAENVDYRFTLWEISLDVARLHPWFGDQFFMRNPMMEPLRQGQGIIDVTNSYLQVLLAHGAVGLALFIVPFISALRAARRLQLAAIANGDEHVERLGRALLATVVGIMVTIATVSSIDTIPTLYWVVIGLCVGTTRAFYSEARSAQAQKSVRHYAGGYDVKADSTV
jgi:O-antigen ligase